MWSQKGPGWSNDHWTNDNHNQSTAQCYSAVASSDGTVICGLQDNGFVKYVGSGQWPAIAGGDGAEGAIDPDHPKKLIGSYVNMNIYESQNGGKTYTTISPGDPFPRFVSPIFTDPTNSDHIVTLGQKVWETTKGYATTSSDWKALYDLAGVRQGTAGRSTVTTCTWDGAGRVTRRTSPLRPPSRAGWSRTWEAAGTS